MDIPMDIFFRDPRKAQEKQGFLRCRRSSCKTVIHQFKSGRHLQGFPIKKWSEILFFHPFKVKKDCFCRLFSEVSYASRPVDVPCVAVGVLIVGDGDVAALAGVQVVQEAEVGAVDPAGLVVVDPLVFAQHIRALFL